MRHSLFKSFWVSIFLLSFLPGLVVSTVATAEDATTNTYQIEPMSRRDALVELAKKAGYEILFSYDASPKDTVEAYATPLPLEDVLSKLLEGTDLRFTIVEKQIRISRIGQEYSRLPPVTVLGYLRSSNKNVSHGDDTQERFPLYQVPLSIQSISREYIEEVQARELEDILNYIGGVEYLNANAGITPSYYSRGIGTPFSIDGKFYRRTLLDQDPAILERIDLVQGPSANFLLPGGMLNFVTKKPENNPFAEFRLTGGSWGFFRSEFDLNLNNNPEKIQGFRFVGVIENKKHFKQHVEKDKYVAAPSFTKEFKNGSQLLLNGSYSHKNETSNTTTIHKDFLPRSIPVDRLLSLPWSKAESKETHAAFDYRNLEIGTWRFNGGGNWYLSEIDNSPVAIGIFPEDHPFYTREGDGFAFRFNADDREIETWGLDTAIERSADIFNIPTLLRVGLDYQNWNINGPIYSSPGGGNLQPLDLFNIYDPNYDIPEPVKATATGRTKQITDFWGLFVSQNFYFSDLLTVHLDLRYEDMQTNFHSQDSEPSPSDWNLNVTYSEFTPQIGANFKFTDSFSSHISYSESFSAQTIADADTVDNFFTIDGEYVDPVKNRQWELAFKNKLFDEKLASNLTLYKIRVSNMQYIWSDGTSFFNGRFEDQHSRGLSFNINGALSDAINIVLNYAYNETETAVALPTGNINGIAISEPVFETDKTVPGTAKSIGNAWLSYDSKQGPFKNYEFGLGLKYIGDRYGDNQNSFKLPAYRTVEFVTRYSGFEKLEIAFVIRNMLDEYYYKGGLGVPELTEEGDPRSFYLTFKSSHDF
ncbi:MAG: TonB-dependent receptor [Agarilytica sp.]